MSMKKSFGILGAYSIAASILSSEKEYPITLNPESERDKLRREYQQELEDEFLKNEYALIQKKESKLSANQRRKVVVMYEKRFGNQNPKLI
jgi:hypothetical protein